MQLENSSNHIFNTVFDKLPVFVIAFCQEGKVLFYNKMAEVTCGKKISTLMFGDIFTQERRTPESESEITYEYRIGGKYYHVTDFYSEYNGIANARILIGYDITNFKDYVFNHNNRSMIDSMTGAYNREVGIDLLREMLSQVELDKAFFSVVYIDLDNLKHINDNFGHIEGDSYILAVSEVIHSHTRKEDTVSRMGGDEFLIIFPRLTHDDTHKILTSISEKLVGVNETLPDGIACCISYGVYEINSLVPLDVEHILKYVDDEMYLMKAENRAKYGMLEIETNEQN